MEDDRGTENNGAGEPVGAFAFEQVEVPGHPGFRMFDATGRNADPQLERDYRTGFYLAIATMLAAVEKGGAYARGYQHGIAQLGEVMRRKGRLSASDLEEWIGETGREWAHEVRSDMQVLPPSLGAGRKT